MSRFVAAAALLACALAACDHPPFTLRFRLTAGDSQQCHGDNGTVTTSCQDVTMLCDAYLSIRVLSPDDPTAPYISMCEPLDPGQSTRLPTLCSIATPNLVLPEMPVVEQTLEVQMAVFPASAITTDPDTGLPVCPRVEFAANGLPMPVISPCDEPDPFACPKVPAVGGRAFYNPGDEKTVVDLGCTNLEQLTDPEVCTGVERIEITATVNDFDNPVSSVDRTVADRLNVSVGEPQPLADTYVLGPEDTEPLDRTMASTPSWSAVVTNLNLVNAACLEVLEESAATTSAVTCRSDVVGLDEFSLPGYFLKRATLTEILNAIGLASFPETGGLVVGMVVDENFSPLAGQQVACAGCTVQYLNGTRTGVVASSTSTSGVFVSRDAPFGTAFSLPGSTQTPSVIGGIVEGKVTIVVLQFKDTVVGGG